MSDKIVFENLKGVQRILNVYEDRVTLTQIKNVRSFLTKDLFNGEKVIYFSDMTSIQFKNPSKLILGYIQFEVPGVHTASNFGSENSWTFDMSLESKAKEVSDYINKRISEFKSGKGNSVVQQVSPADELKKYKDLLDSGVITESEFAAKKKELLGL